ncbi:MAG: sulfite exporter TauE/SafE family protein [Gammaproteobacteria bacterium]
MTDLLIYLATGAFAGVLAGLFGVGGGLVMVPILAWLLPLQGVGADYMQVAIGTSLAVIAATSISSTLAHQRRGAVAWPVFLRVAAGLVLGALLGAHVADALGSPALRRIVGVGALLVALQLLLGGTPAARPAGTRPHALELFGAGGIIGALSSLIGIGGGSLTVPYLSLRGLPIHQAVGTAAACGVPIAWAGALGFIWTGWGQTSLGGWHLGYVSLSAFAGLAVASVLAAPLGARLAHGLPPRTLKRAFAVLLVAVALWMLH